MKGELASVQASCLVHLTEDRQRVARALQALLGAAVPPDAEELQGHHGNGIVKLTFHLTGADADAALKRVLAGLAPGAREQLVASVPELVDEHSALYFRLDKQSLFGGGATLGGREPVRVKVKPRLFLMKGGAPDFYRRLLGG